MLTDQELAALLADTGISLSQPNDADGATIRIALFLVHALLLAGMIGLLTLIQ